MCSKFGNVLSLAFRERCMANLKKNQIPVQIKDNPATAAVLVAICRVEEVPSLLYTKRASNLRTDSGLISFPGGKTDNNETSVQTALRETEEEIGLSPSKIEIWGHGPPVPGRNREMAITPVIGSITNLHQNDINVNCKEVTDVFAVSLECLCDPKNQCYTQFKNGYILPVFTVGQLKIWGLTAYITHVFLNSLLTKDFYRNEWMKKKIVIR